MIDLQREKTNQIEGIVQLKIEKVEREKRDEKQSKSDTRGAKEISKMLKGNASVLPFPFNGEPCHGTGTGLWQVLTNCEPQNAIMTMRYESHRQIDQQHFLLISCTVPL